MHDLKVNFDKFHQIAKTILSDKLVDGNVRLYRHKPKMTDSEIMAEFYGTNSGRYLPTNNQNDLPLACVCEYFLETFFRSSSELINMFIFELLLPPNLSIFF